MNFSARLKLLMYVELYIIAIVALQSFGFLLLKPLEPISRWVLASIYHGHDFLYGFIYAVPRIFFGLVWACLTCFILFTIASFSEIMLKLHSVAKPKNLPASEVKFFESILAKDEVSRLRFLPGDMAVGAYTRGWFSPKVIVSLGLIIAAHKGDKRPTLILYHENAHIRHMDRLMLAVPFFAVLIFAFNIIYYLTHASITIPLVERAFESSLWINLFVMPWILYSIFFSLSKNRELGADLYAASLGSSGRYLEFLQESIGSHSGKTRSRFHPPLRTRISALEAKSHPLLGFSVRRNALYSFWVVAFFLQSQSPWSPYQMDKYGTFEPIVAVTSFLIVVFTASAARLFAKIKYQKVQ